MATSKGATKTYRLTQGSHGRVEDGVMKIYKAKDPERDVITLTDKEAAGLLKGRVVEVPAGTGATKKAKVASPDPDDGADDGDGDDNAGDTWEEALSSLSAPDAIKAIQQLTDPDDVRMALDAEKAGKARATVLDAASTRLKELGGGGK